MKYNKILLAGIGAILVYVFFKKAQYQAFRNTANTNVKKAILTDVSTKISDAQQKEKVLQPFTSVQNKEIDIKKVQSRDKTSEMQKFYEEQLIAKDKMKVIL